MQRLQRIFRLDIDGQLLGQMLVAMDLAWRQLGTCSSAAGDAPAAPSEGCAAACTHGSNGCARTHCVASLDADGLKPGKSSQHSPCHRSSNHQPPRSSASVPGKALCGTLEP